MKLTIPVILAIVFFGVTRIAQFLCACACILFFGFAGYQIIFGKDQKKDQWKAA